MRAVLADNVVKPIIPLYNDGDVTFSDIESDYCDNGFNVYTSGVLNNSSTIKYSGGNFMSIRKDAMTSDIIYDSSASDELYVGNCYIQNDDSEYLNITIDGVLEFTDTLDSDCSVVFNISEFYDSDTGGNVFMITNGLYLLSVDDTELTIYTKTESDILSTQMFTFSELSGNTFNLLNDSTIVELDGHSTFEGIDMTYTSFALLDDISDYGNTGFDVNSKWVSYDVVTEPSYNKTERLLELSDTVIEDLTVDYLVTAAPLGDNITEGTDVSYMTFNMMPLNTFSTVTGDASVSEDTPTNSSLKLRDYLDISINETQSVSASNIKLSFNGTGGLIQNFESEVECYFHIPDTFEDVDLIDDTSLKLAGATAGTTTDTSDKIYKYNVTSDNSTPWTNESLDGSGDGTWACSWLELQTDGTSVWVEYDLDTDSYVDSTMVLEARGYYKYLRIGDTSDRIDEIVIGSDYADAVIYINDMSFEENTDNSKYIMTDVSSYGNDAVVNDNDNATTGTTEVGNDISAILLNGSSTINIPANITYKSLTEKTLSLFGYMDDWTETDTPSYVLCTDQYKSGSSISWVNHGLYEITALPDPTTNKVNILDADGDFVNSVSLSDYYSGSIGVAIIDNNMFIVAYQISDTSSRLLLVSPNGDKIESQDHDIIVTDLVYAGFGTMYVTTSTVIYTLNPIALTITETDTKSSDELIVVHVNSSSEITYSIVSGAVSADMTADGESTIYIDESSNIYIDTEPVLLTTDEIPLDVAFDTDGNAYYAVYDSTIDDGVVKLTIVDYDSDYNETRKVLLSDLGELSSPKGTLGISKMVVDDVFTDVVILQLSTNQYVIYNIDTEAVTSINSFNTPDTALDISVYGDTTGYKYNKVVHYLNDSVPRIQYLVIAHDGDDSLLEVYETAASVLSSFWNHFCIKHYSVDDDVNAKVYLNADEYWEVTNNILIEYETDLTFGCSATTGSPLSVVNGVETRSMYGAISNILMTNRSLDDDEITLLYGKLSGGDSTMSWEIGGSADTFVEQIDRVFKCKQPSSKSNYFDINITGDFTSTEQTLIEDYINNNISDIVPVNSNLLNINWD